MKLVLAGRHAGAKGLLSPAEPPLVWLKAVRAWFESAARQRLERARVDVQSHGAPVLLLRLHPAAEDVSILSATSGRVVVQAATASVGPGYHRWLCELLRAFGDQFQINWAEGVGDATGYFETADAARLEAEMLRWLKAAAARALELRKGGHGAVALSLRFGRMFACDAALVTPMGPRDDAWLAAVRADPSQGTDVFPWWAPGDNARSRLDPPTNR